MKKLAYLFTGFSLLFLSYFIFTQWNGDMTGRYILLMTIMGFQPFIYSSRNKIAIRIHLAGIIAIIVLVMLLGFGFGYFRQM